nr:MAG TPA: hypothetical protein [Microviridae sp.]
MRKQIRVILSNSPSLVHKRTTHTPSQMVLSPQFLKKFFGNTKKNLYLCPL